MTNNGRRLLQEDCLIASNILRELSINQNFAQANRRLAMEATVKRKLGKWQSAYFFRGVLNTLKNNNKRLMKRR